MAKVIVWRKMLDLGTCMFALQSKPATLVIGWFVNSNYGFPKLYRSHCIRIGHLGISIRLNNAK